jgi:hypothetical protein
MHYSVNDTFEMDLVLCLVIENFHLTMLSATIDLHLIRK